MKVCPGSYQHYYCLTWVNKWLCDSLFSLWWTPLYVPMGKLYRLCDRIGAFNAGMEEMKTKFLLTSYDSKISEKAKTLGQVLTTYFSNFSLTNLNSM